MPVHIAGIGTTAWSWSEKLISPARTRHATRRLALSAGTKALLDAGLSYDNVDHAFGCGSLSGDYDTFYTFGKTGIAIQGAVDPSTGLYMAHHLVETGRADCVLLLAVNQYASVGIVAVSDALLWRYPYLKDSAVAIRSCVIATATYPPSSISSTAQAAVRQAGIEFADIQALNSNQSFANNLDIETKTSTEPGSGSFSDLCTFVWRLRGWIQDDSTVQNCLFVAESAGGIRIGAVLSRFDGQVAPKFDEVKHKNDGRDRLRYNPAVSVQEISAEDLEAVKSMNEILDPSVVDKVGFRRKGGDRAALAKL